MRLVTRKLIRDVFAAKMCLLNLVSIALIVISVAVCDILLQTLLFPGIWIDIAILFIVSIFLYFTLGKMLKINMQEIELMIYLGVSERKLFRSFIMSLGTVLVLSVFLGYGLGELFVNAYFEVKFKIFEKTFLLLTLTAEYLLINSIVGYWVFFKAVKNT